MKGVPNSSQARYTKSGVQPKGDRATATGRSNDLRAFRWFVDEKLSHGEADLTLEVSLTYWEYENQSEDDAKPHSRRSDKDSPTPMPGGPGRSRISIATLGKSTGSLLEHDLPRPGPLPLDRAQPNLLLDRDVAIDVANLHADPGVGLVPVDGDQAEIVPQFIVATRWRFVSKGRQVLDDWLNALAVTS